MRPILVIAAALLLMPPPSPADAQEAEPQDTAAHPAPAPQPQRFAIPRGSRPQGDRPATSTPARAGKRTTERTVRAVPAGAVSRNAAAQEQEPAPEPERRAVPRGSRPQGDNPRTGTAIQRPATPPRSVPPDRGSITNRGRTVIVPDRRSTIIVQRPSIFDYYYPRSYYPYGYGAFGLGYFYYDPYRWYGGYAPGGGYTTYGYSDSYRRPFSTFDIGELRLDVSPRSAQVYVDGYYAGVVDDYDGAFQALKLEPGAHRIEITAPGYESLTFDVFLNPSQKIKYEGDLRRAP